MEKISVSLEDFKKLDLRVGRITAAERIDGSDKLLKLIVDFGKLGARQIIAGLAQFYMADELTGSETIFVFNLEPRRLVGMESQGMILAADSGGRPVILKPDRDIPPGSVVR